MAGDIDQLLKAPTNEEIVNAQETLREGRRAVEAGTWNADMQAARDHARGVVNRAQAAGVL